MLFHLIARVLWGLHLLLVYKSITLFLCVGFVPCNLLHLLYLHSWIFIFLILHYYCLTPPHCRGDKKKKTQKLYFSDSAYRFDSLLNYPIEKTIYQIWTGGYGGQMWQVHRFSDIPPPAFFLSFLFLGAHPCHMEVHRLGSNWSCTCRPAPQPLTTVHGNARPPTHGVRPEIKPATSWFPGSFISAAPQWELHKKLLFKG